MRPLARLQLVPGGLRQRRLLLPARPHIFGKASYVRGAGSGMTCAPGQEYDAGLWYTTCASGYRGAGLICYQNCPAGYSGDGATCRRDSGVQIVRKDSYGRGAGPPAGDILQRILGADDLGLVPFLTVRWCGAPG